MQARQRSELCLDGLNSSPNLLRFIELKLSGDPAGYQFGLIGKYNLQSDLETGRHYWVKENGNYAIWYTEHNVVLLFLAIISDF